MLREIASRTIDPWQWAGDRPDLNPLHSKPQLRSLCPVLLPHTRTVNGKAPAETRRVWVPDARFTKTSFVAEPHAYMPDKMPQFRESVNLPRLKFVGL